MTERRRRAGRSRLAVAAVLVGALGVLGAACSDGTREQVIYSTTTSSAPERGAEPASTVPPVDLDEYEGALRAAVADSDLCALLDAVELRRPDVADPEVVTRAYDALARATEEASSFVPDELSAAWAEVVAANRDAARLARRAKGAIGDPSIEARFETSTFSDAYVKVTGWADLNCGGSTGRAG